MEVNTSDVQNKIRRLEELKVEGILSDEEFESKRQQLIEVSSPASVGNEPSPEQTSGKSSSYPLSVNKKNTTLTLFKIFGSLILTGIMLAIMAAVPKFFLVLSVVCIIFAFFVKSKGVIFPQKKWATILVFGIVLFCLSGMFAMVQQASEARIAQEKAKQEAQIKNNYDEGQQLMTEGNYEQARSKFMSIPQDSPYYADAVKGYKDAELKLAPVYYEEGKKLYEEGNYEAAAEKLGKAVEYDSSLADAVALKQQVTAKNDEIKAIEAEKAKQKEAADQAAAEQQRLAEIQAQTVSAVQISKEYNDNEVAADLKYKDKTLYVSGVLDNVSKGLGGGMYLILKGETYSFVSIQCSFDDKYTSELAALSPGQSLLIKGKCTGVFGNVGFTDCQLVY